jgi:hypothetical protein
MKKIDDSISIIKENNRFSDTFDFLHDIKFNDEVWYEDIKEKMIDSLDIDLGVTPQPKNYQDILELIKSKL